MKWLLACLMLGLLTCQRPPPVAVAARQMEEPDDPPGFWNGRGWGQGYEHREEPPPRPRMARAIRPPPAPVFEALVLEEPAAAEVFDSSLLDRVDAALAETEEALKVIKRARK
jgi:hypothetical protein